MGTKEYLLRFCGQNVDKVDEIAEILEAYYDNNGRKIYQIVDKIIKKFGGVYDAEHFYSLANKVISHDVIPSYDWKSDFNGFVYSCLCKKIKSEMTRQNRVKRKSNKNCLYLDAPIGDGENCTYGEIVPSKFDLDKEVFGEENISNPKIEKYLNRLSKIQRKIVELLAADYKPAEIKDILHITQEQYSDYLIGIHAYENISVLL